MNDLLLATAQGNRDALAKFWNENGEPDVETLDLITLQSKSLERLRHTAFDVNACFGGYTALHIAAKNGNKEVVELLLQKEAKIEVKSSKGLTALYIAAEKGYKEIVKLLLQKEAKSEPQGSKLFTPLQIAAEKGHEEIVDLLIKAGADIEDQVLHIAAENGHKEIIKVLIKEGADIEAEDSEGFTALHAAAQRGHKEVVELLLQEGADIDAKSSNTGFTALHFAAFKYDKEMVELLLQKGANIETQDFEGQMALDRAAENEEIVKLLLPKRPKIEAQDIYGRNALHIAAKKGYTEIVELLLQKGVDIDAKSSNTGFTALHFAAFKYNKEMVELLLQKGAKIDAQDIYKRNALHIAAKMGHKEMVELLLQKGADIEAKICSGSTALEIAAENEEIVKLLLPKGPKIEAQDIYGRKAFHIAAKKGYTDVLEYLISIGVDVGAQDESGNTAMKTVILSGCKKIEVVSLLSHCKKLLDLNEPIIRNYLATNIDQIIECELSKPNNTLQGLYNILESFSNAGDNDFCKGFINKIKSPIVKVINKDFQIDLTIETNIQKFNENLSETKNIQELLDIRSKLENFKRLLPSIEAKPTNEDMLVNSYMADLYKIINSYKKICQSYSLVNEKIASFARPINIPKDPFPIAVSYMDSDNLLNLFKAKYCLKEGELIQNMEVSYESMAKRQKLTDITNQTISLNLSESDSGVPKLDSDYAEIEITGQIENI